MRVLFVGDVHACAHELAIMVDRSRADQVVLVGDLFTKGPDPVGVWHLIRQHHMLAVLGNHDQRLIDAMANERPRDGHAHEVIAALDGDDISWRSWLLQLPLSLEIDGWLVVHAGLHPSGQLQETTREMLLYMRTFPQDDVHAAPWHAQYQGTQRVVFGHDARRGLVRYDHGGEARVVGLDTGCVYGGVLSGWMPSLDKLIQVPASIAYAPLRGVLGR